ncbi:hypothetical protein CORAM0001_1769 [Corynebacterium amycolatum SK46]|nr:hypothetical protein CORAM0001_1769 [Corynebacterium amycolatum SK46]
MVRIGQYRISAKSQGMVAICGATIGAIIGGSAGVLLFNSCVL